MPVPKQYWLLVVCLYWLIHISRNTVFLLTKLNASLPAMSQHWIFSIRKALSSQTNASTETVLTSSNAPVPANIGYITPVVNFQLGHSKYYIATHTCNINKYDL